jgi:dTDP-4-amino-4,6-dideoxygalactose transaminase
MLNAISRYGARIVPNTEQTIAALRQRGELVRGPLIEEFERAFAAKVSARHAVAASYGRMAFYYLLKALNLPAGSEIVVPALTFWVIPELARVAGLTVVFADVDPQTFTLDPGAFAGAITPRTRVVMPTHLYGLPCEMDAIMRIARQHQIVVIEDCAHALGAAWRGQPVGTIGDAGFFSFQLLKPLNTYGGGMAVTNDAELARAVAAQAAAERWPTDDEVLKRLWLGRVQRIAIKPKVFTWSLFPMLWAGSYLQATPDVYLWEKIRPLDPMPASYRTRYANVQAAIGLEGLQHLDAWTCRTVSHANAMTAALAWARVETPTVPTDRTHVYYQYAVYAQARDEVVKQCIRRGIDVETLHVDVCTRLPLFGGSHRPAPGAERAAEAIQVPVHAALSDDDIARIARTLRDSALAAAN